MKIFSLLGILIFTGYLSACSSAPDAVDYQGHPIVVNHYRGKWVMINYWASWCEPCLPDLNRLYQRYPEKVIVLGVNYDGEDADQLKLFAEKHSLSFPLLSHFPSEKWGLEEVSVLPMTLIIDPEGHFKTVLKGPHTEKEFEAIVKANE